MSSSALIAELRELLKERSAANRMGGVPVATPPTDVGTPKTDLGDVKCSCPAKLPCTCGYEDEFDGKDTDDKDANPNMFPYGVTNTPYGIGSSGAMTTREGVETMQLKFVETSPTGSNSLQFSSMDEAESYIDYAYWRHEGQVTFSFAQHLLPQVAEALGDDLEIDEETLAEVEKHYPFKTKGTLGKTGVPGFSPGKQRSKAKKWKCKSAGKYIQLCKPIGKNKEDEKYVKVDREWKGRYNPAYRAAVAKSKRKARKGE